MNSTFVRLALASVILTAAIASAAQHTTLIDRQIKAQVEERLSALNIRGVVVAVDNRTVTLSGTVPSLWAKDEAIEEARKVHDISSVVSALTVVRGESDRALGEALAMKLRRYVFFTIFDDVEVEVTDGVARLTGYVTMPYKAHAMAKLASRVDGVQAVVDELEALPVSSVDDEIRYTLASRIYNDPLFWNYAIQVNPPVHIVVKHGRVTLTGVVISNVERRKAEQLAREVFGVLNVENKLRLASES
jgi:osmotically-inducible protein OsmY